MSQEHDHESVDGLTEQERRTAVLLERERPIPRAVFRGELRRRLTGARPGMALRTPWWVLSGSYLGAGLLCLASALLGVAGVGPFAA
jgi:hypothetical protein